MSEQKVCPNPEECCKELSRVWAALMATGYDPALGSVSERVARLQAQLATAEADRDAARAERDRARQQVEDFCDWWAEHRDGSPNAAYARIDAFMAAARRRGKE